MYTITCNLRIPHPLRCDKQLYSMMYRNGTMVLLYYVGIPTSTFSVTLHLYRRAIAEAIARGLSLHKRSRLHFVRGSRDEAARVAEEAKNHLRLADALLVVMDSWLVIRFENMATMSNLEVLEVDLNGTTSNSLRRSLPYFLHLFLSGYVYLKSKRVYAVKVNRSSHTCTGRSTRSSTGT